MAADGMTACGRIGTVRFTLRPNGAPPGMSGHLEVGQYSPSYGRVVAAPVLRFEWTGLLPQVARFTLLAEDGASCSGRAPDSVTP